jgi:predicted acyltransferase
MLLVNNVALDAATPRHLTHADWSGAIHLADLVFPWFLLIVGVAIPYSAASLRRQGLPPWRYPIKALARAAALYLLGCLVDSTIAHRPVIGLGVLQLIALAYLVAALFAQLAPAERLLVAAALLVGHWTLIRFLPLPGVGAGHFSETTNAIRYLNERYLEPLGLKGVLSVIPTAALTLVGTVIGDLFRRESGIASTRKVVLVEAFGLGLVLLGLLWSRDLPMNKPLWTASYVLCAAGWGAVALGLLYGIIDVAGWRWWAFPLVVAGMNAIVAYVAPILVKVNILQTWRWTMPDGSHLPLQAALQHACYVALGRVPGGWLYTLGYIGVWWLALYLLYRKRLFLRV